MVAFARANANSNVSGIVYHELTRQTENEHEINEGIASESLESIHVMLTTTNS